MTTYNKEQLDALKRVSTALTAMDSNETDRLKKEARDYLAFREQVATFSHAHLAAICKQKCYDTGLSACCTREGIITYFTDVVLNVLFSTPNQLDRLAQALIAPKAGNQCVYLSPQGCLWTLKPIVCEMFFCDWLKDEARAMNPSLPDRIADFKIRQKAYTWPDKPVIFNRIETIFLEKGCTSPLMYFHTSPGLIRIKKKAGLV